MGRLGRAAPTRPGPPALGREHRGRASGLARSILSASLNSLEKTLKKMPCEATHPRTVPEERVG